MLKKYIALKDEYIEAINWSAGARVWCTKKSVSPELKVYVSMWTNDGNRHTVLGTDMDLLLKQCYDEFIDGERNNIIP